MQKNLLIFIFSTILISLGFALFIIYFPFPHTSEKYIVTKYVKVIAAQTALYFPYKYWYPVALIYFPVATFLVWRLFCYIFKVNLRVKEYLIEKAEKIKQFTPFELSICVLILGPILISSSYSSFYMFFYNYHHYTFITGPLNDVLHGKFLLVNSSTQYGFFNIFLTSWIFKAGLYFSEANAHFLTMILVFIEYFLFYMIIRVLTNSKIFSFICVFFFTSINFYGVYPELFSSEIYVWPSRSSWNFFPFMPTTLLILLWLKRRTKIYFYLVQIAVAIGFFWSLETGIPLLLGYISFLFLLFYNSELSFKERLKSLFFSSLSLVGMMLMIVLLYSLYTLVLAGKIPNWHELIYWLSIFNDGLHQTEGYGPKLGIGYLPIFLYGFIILWSIVRKYHDFGLDIKIHSFFAMISVYGYVVYRYYIGYQVDLAIWAFITPAVIIYLYLTYRFIVWFNTQHPNSLRKIISPIFSALTLDSFPKINKFLLPKSNNNNKITKIRYLSLLFLYIFVLTSYSWGLFRFVKWTYKLNKERYNAFIELRNNPIYNFPPKNHIVAVENTAVPTETYQELKSTVDAMKSYEPNNRKLAIIGYFDHIFLMEAERTALADYWYVNTIMTKKEMDDIVKLYSTKPKYIFVDKRVLREAALSISTDKRTERSYLIPWEIFDRIKKHFKFEKDIGMIYVYKRIN